MVKQYQLCNLHVQLNTTHIIGSLAIIIVHWHTKPFLSIFQGTAVFEPLPTEAGTLYTYQPLSLIETYGPGVPDLEELESYGLVLWIIHSSYHWVLLSLLKHHFSKSCFRYLSNIRGVDEQHMGSGFEPAYACQRALQEAFSCLLLPPEDR